MDSPEVSVVIPTFNRRNSLARALGGLERQSVAHSRFEVLVVDDGSTDGTSEWLAKLRPPFQLRHFVQGNQGPAVARNRGVQEARAALVLFIDDDTEPLPELLAEHLAAHGADRSIAVCGPLGSLPHYPEPWVAWEQRQLEKQYAAMARGDYAPTFRQFWTGNASLPRARILEAGGFDPKFLRAEDVELALRLHERGLQFRFNPRARVLHHAQRSLDSWCAMHQAYGSAEVAIFERATHGDPVEILAQNWRRLNPILRKTVLAALTRSEAHSTLVSALRAGLALSPRLPFRRADSYACSLLANLLYWEASAKLLGPRRFARTVGEPAPRVERGEEVRGIGVRNKDMHSVLVCTRDRPQMLVRLVRSLLSDAQTAEVLIVDQSSSRETESAMASLPEDARLKYVRSKTLGKGAALNEGLRIAQGDIIICTDDDCEAPPGWVAGMCAALLAQPDAAVAFCQVLSAPFDPLAGFIPTFKIEHTRLIRSVRGIVTRPGLGAGMAVRRSAVLSLGGFDEAFGPGALFASCDDWDIAVRAILRGFAVLEVAELSIVHHGFRDFAIGREHAKRDWFAIGAVCAKSLRVGRVRDTAPLAARTFLRNAVFPPFADLVRLQRPRGVGRVTAFLAGFAMGFLTKIERERMLFTAAAADH